MDIIQNANRLYCWKLILHRIALVLKILIQGEKNTPGSASQSFPCQVSFLFLVLFLVLSRPFFLLCVSRLLGLHISVLLCPLCIQGVFPPPLLCYIVLFHCDSGPARSSYLHLFIMARVLNCYIEFNLSLIWSYKYTRTSMQPVDFSLLTPGSLRLKLLEREADLNCHGQWKAWPRWAMTVAHMKYKNVKLQKKKQAIQSHIAIMFPFKDISNVLFFLFPQWNDWASHSLLEYDFKTYILWFHI